MNDDPQVSEWVTENTYTSYLGGLPRRLLNGGADLNELIEIAASLRARPQEPGDLISREEAIAVLRPIFGVVAHSSVLDACINALESLAPSGPLSDPEGVFEAMGMDEPKFPTTKKEGE